MISTTDLGQHTLEQVEPIHNFFVAISLARVGMLIHVHFLSNNVDILVAAVILVIVIKSVVVSTVVKEFGYTNKTSLFVGMSMAQIGEFAFVLPSRALNLHLVEGKLYLLLLGTIALSLGTADAVRQYLWLLEDHNVMEFLVLGGDHAAWIMRNLFKHTGRQMLTSLLWDCQWMKNVQLHLV